MTQEIRIPDIGDAEAVEVVEICVAPGDRVAEDDALIVIESDKASMEVPAGVAGVIEEITVALGDEVREGKVIARISGADGGAASVEDAAAPDRAAGTDGDDDADRARAEAPDAGAAVKRAAADTYPGSTKATLEIRVPDVGEATNVVVIEVAVAPGDQVSESDLLVVVESDKASMEIPANHRGRVRSVHVAEGDEVEEGTLLVTLETEAPLADAEPSAERSAEPSAERSAEPSAEAAPAEDEAPRRPAEETSAGPAVYAGPAVRRLARELGVNLAEVQGSGGRGRIVKDDVKSFVKSRMSGSAPSAGGGVALPVISLPDFSRFGETETLPMSRIRVRGAENLHRSWVNLPHVTQHDEVDVTDLEQFRKSLKVEAESRGVKITPLAFIIKACCHALKLFPTVNASLDTAAGTFILKRYYHIGMAVDTEEGLVVPVIRDADRKGIWELSEEIVALADKARAQKLSMNDLQGGSFSVTSLGAIGGTGFTPIINAPEVAILGISRMTTRPSWNGSEFEPRQMLPLSLSYDHRALNGAEAGRFVSSLGELLRDIRRLTL